MDKNEKELNLFVDKILAIQKQSKNKLLTNNELKNIAEQIGISEGEWQAIQETFDNHLFKGKEFIKYKNFDDSVNEFKQAVAINPNSEEANYYLAFSYKNLWQKTNNLNDKNLANTYARRCLELNPKNTDAIKLISSLKTSPKKSFTVSKSSPKKSYRGLFIVIGIFVVLFVFFFIIFDVPSTSTIEIEKENNVVAEINSESSSSEVKAESNYSKPTKGGIPVNFIVDDNSENLVLNVQNVEYRHYSKNTGLYFSILGELELKKIDVQELQIQVNLYDQTNKIIVSDFKTIVASHSFGYRSGDIIPFRFFKMIKDSELPAAKKIDISVSKITQTVSSGSYEPSQRADYKWGIPKPNNYDVDVRMRHLVPSEASFGNTKTYLKMVLEVENKGNLPIKHLCFMVQFFDKEGKLIENNKIYAITTGQTILPQGKTRIHQRTFALEIDAAKFDTYKLSITDIK